MSTSVTLPLSLIPLPKNRRVSTRVAAILPVELVFAQSDRGTFTARSADIGMHGICVKTASPIADDEVRLVRFTLGRSDLEFCVTRRWSSEAISGEGSSTGFIFDAVAAESQLALWDFIQRRAQEIGEFLRSCAALDQLAFQEALELALLTHLRDVKSGQMLYGDARLDSSSSILVLFRGSVVLERASTSRNERIAEVQPGELFGGLPMIAGCTPFERAVASEDSTLLEFSEHNIEYLISAKPQLAVALLRAATFHWMRRFSNTLDTSFGQSALQ